MRGQPGRDFFLQLLQMVVRIRAAERVEHQLNPRERLSALLERDERVLERSGRWVVRNRLHFSQMLPHALFERWLEIGVLDFVERGRLKWQRARNQKGVGLRRALR